ncbi:MAG TPA: hypothetical protein VM182_14095, partial [Terriglobia bacterium]|nr:hypothetical protein [Terriglobia bacterium]
FFEREKGLWAQLWRNWVHRSGAPRRRHALGSGEVDKWFTNALTRGRLIGNGNRLEFTGEISD